MRPQTGANPCERLWTTHTSGKPWPVAAWCQAAHGHLGAVMVVSPHAIHERVLAMLVGETVFLAVFVLGFLALAHIGLS